MKEANSSTR